MTMVELDDVAFDLVGLPGGAGTGSGLNVDARKRLTLAVELVANPSVVFMDEPTSGVTRGCCTRRRAPTALCSRAHAPPHG